MLVGLFNPPMLGAVVVGGAVGGLVGRFTKKKVEVPVAGAQGVLVANAFTSYAGLDIGRDNGLVVDRDYEDQAPYPFSGAIDKVTFDLAPVTHEEALALHQHEHDHAVGGGVAG